MNWIEIIELRSLSLKPEKLKEFKQTVTEKEQKGGIKGLEIYHSVSVATDTSIHIHWITRDDLIGKSTLGLRLASEMKQFGRVNHTIWIKD